MSLPVVREADTINARPSLASHAPRVSKIIQDEAKGIMFNASVNGIIKTILRVIPSNAKRDIRR